MHFICLHYYLTRVCLGLLVSACVNRAPEGTFGCAVAEVGVHDLLKVCLVHDQNCITVLILVLVPQIHHW